MADMTVPHDQVIYIGDVESSESGTLWGNTASASDVTRQTLDSNNNSSGSGGNSGQVSLESSAHGYLMMSSMASSSSYSAPQGPQVISLLEDPAEYFSPPRILPHVQHLGMRGKWALDLQAGHDLTYGTVRALAWHTVREHRPLFIMLSPPCTMFSALQTCFKNFERMDPQVVHERMVEAEGFMSLTAALAQTQLQSNRFFCIQHPHKASSWSLPYIKSLTEHPQCQVTDFDQCCLGLRCPESGLPICKRTRLLSNAPAVATYFAPHQCACQGPRAHKQIEGNVCGVKLSEYCQRYPFQMCATMANAVRDTAEQAVRSGFTAYQ